MNAVERANDLRRRILEDPNYEPSPEEMNEIIRDLIGERLAAIQTRSEKKTERVKKTAVNLDDLLE